MDSALIKALPRVPIASLMPPEIDCIEEEKALEKALKTKINGLRFSECGLKWKWDKQLEYMLSTALYNYEMERLASLTFASNEFKSSIKHYVPEGHTFKAFPIQFNHFDINKMILSLFKNKVAYEVITARGDSVNHAARVKIVAYPEKVCAVWVIIAVRYQPVGE
jgi:centrosomal protein CEP76